MVTVRRERERCPDCWLSLGVAGLVFPLVFLAPVLGFWAQLAVTCLLLAALALVFDRAGIMAVLRSRQQVILSSLGIGVTAAAALYGVFFVGREIVSRIHPDGRALIGSVYTLGAGPAVWRIGLVLLLVVGPCEEIFWRGYIQRRLTNAYGGWGVAIAIAAYTAVHLATGNPVLIAAAFVCGTFWGLLFRRSGDLAANIVSHALWAATIFAFLPLA